jgi:hypothetical protein
MAEVQQEPWLRALINNNKKPTDECPGVRISGRGKQQLVLKLRLVTTDLQSMTRQKIVTNNLCTWFHQNQSKERRYLIKKPVSPLKLNI